MMCTSQMAGLVTTCKLPQKNVCHDSVHGDNLQTIEVGLCTNTHTHIHTPELDKIVAPYFNSYA